MSRASAASRWLAREPTQHPSPHLLLHCGEILWPQRGRLGELDLPVGAGNEHPSITQQWMWTYAFNVLPKRCTKLTAPIRPRTQP